MPARARYDAVTNSLHGRSSEIVRSQSVYVYKGITPRDEYDRPLDVLEA